MSKGDSASAELTVEGDLLFSTIVSKRDTLLEQLKGLTGQCCIDFGKVGRVDSSALSLWLCCQRFAKAKSLSLEVINLPSDMLSIAKLVGIDDQLN